MAFKAINNTTGPNGLVPTLLVFSVYPQIVELDAPLLLVIQRVTAIKKAIVEIQKLQADRQVVDALNIRNRPKTNAVHDLPLNSPVLV